MTDWDPNHQLLKSPQAPHETAGVLRMQRAGYPGAEMMKTLKVRATSLVKQLQNAMEEENKAHQAGRPIHDALIAPEPKK